MTILQNALDSIVLGVEDYNNPDHRRLVSCTRNILSGILLLFKHKLSQLSPSGSDEVLIKQQILPSLDSEMELQWKGVGKKTVDVHQIQERFKSLGINVEWDRVNEIVKYRNDIEHYYSSLSRNAVQSLIANSFIVIRDFIHDELGEDPRELLGLTTWSTLTNISEVYKKEKEECTEKIENIDWKYDCLESALTKYQCQECGSGLLDVTADGNNRETAKFVCRSCGERWDFEGLGRVCKL